MSNRERKKPTCGFNLFLGLTLALVTSIACGSSTNVTTPEDGGVVLQHATLTATVGSTQFVTREHMLAAGEMQISGEPFAESMNRTLANYSRDHLPTDLYFDTSQDAVAPWIDLPGWLRRRSNRTSTPSSR